MRPPPASEPRPGPRSSSASGAPTGSSGRAPAIGLCVFDVAAGRFALDVGVVGEVVPVERSIVVPRAPHGVLGLFNLRGIAVALLDLAVLLDMPDPGPRRPGTGAPLGLVLRAGPTVLAALRVDAVVTVIAAAAAAPVPSDRQADHPSVAGFVSTPATGVVSLLDDAFLQQRIATLRSRELQAH
jgi:chemotaxis signal transduction protein